MIGKPLTFFLILLIPILLICSFRLYSDYQQEQLRVLGSRTIPAYICLNPLSPEDPIVSFNYDASVSYGTTPPYDARDNPVYYFIWDVVVGTALGTQSDPLSDLISQGDTVLIKPNMVAASGAAYSHPSVVRPLIDMAVTAGATKIWVGDGSPGFTNGEKYLLDTKYVAMVEALDTKHANIEIRIVNLNDRGTNKKWRWINLDQNSAFAGSSYTDYDMGYYDVTLYNHQYYKTADSYGINPNGQAMGWYAISEYVLDSDVIINVPKMKNHWTNIVTLALKNLVGITVASTYDNSDAGFVRIPHNKKGDARGSYDVTFGNDVLWRSILDLNRIVLYADSQGSVRSTKQRKYFNVLDGIVANEKNAAGSDPYDMKIALASIDPVALDAVGARLMGYNFKKLPGIEEAGLVNHHLVGTISRDLIVIIGDTIDSRFNHIFEYYNVWAQYAQQDSLALTDFTAPSIASVTSQISGTTLTVTSTISGAQYAYILYKEGGIQKYIKMTPTGSTFSGVIPNQYLQYKILAIDNNFNTAHSQLYTNTGDLECLQLEQVTVYVDGRGGQTTKTYSSSKTYKITASGTYQYWFPAQPDGIADAEWSELTSHGHPGWHKGEGENVHPVPHYLDLSIDGANIDWGAYNANHIYSVNLPGKNAKFKFNITDSFAKDNAGSLSVSISDCGQDGGGEDSTCSSKNGQPCSSGQSCVGGRFINSSDHGELCCIIGTCIDVSTNCPTGVSYDRTIPCTPMPLNVSQPPGTLRTCTVRGIEISSVESAIIKFKVFDVDSDQEGSFKVNFGSWNPISVTGDNTEMEFCHEIPLSNLDSGSNTLGFRFDSNLGGLTQGYFVRAASILIKSKDQIADVSKDGVVDIQDLILVIRAFGTSEHDLTGDGTVDVKDLLVVINNL